MEFDKIKAAIIEAAKEAGIEEYEIYFEQHASCDTSAFQSEINRFSSNVSGGLCFRCKIGEKMGYAATQSMVAEEMAELVKQAAENATYIESDEKAFIYSGGDEYKPVKRYERALPTAAEMAKKTLECQSCAYKTDDKVSDGTESGMLSTYTERRIVNSAGLDLNGKTGFDALYINVIANDGEETNTSFEAKIAPFEEIDAEKLAKETVAKAMQKFGSEKVKTGKYDVIFDSSRMLDFLGTFYPVFTAKAVQSGMSLLKGKLGEKIAADCVTLADDPFDPKCPVNASFDAEGVPTYAKNVIDNGVLKTFLYNLTTADNDGVKSTGNAAKGGYASNISTAPYCFKILEGQTTRADLLERMGNGIYITSMKGFHAGADPITGDFSIESAGFLVKDGKIDKPIKEFTVAGNFFELLKSIEALSDTLEYSIPGAFTQFASPDVLIRAMSIGGENNAE